MLSNDPWQHIAIDNFLPEERFKQIEELAKRELDYLDMFGFYTRSGHYIRYLKEDLLPELNDLFLQMPRSRPYTRPLKKLCHWSIHPAGFTNNTHIDNSSRISTFVFYVSPDQNKGTILCKNNSPYLEDHANAELPSEYEIEVPWKPNTLFAHNSLDGETWHRYEATTQRCTLNCFFVQPELIKPDRIENRFLLDLDVV